MGKEAPQFACCDFGRGTEVHLIADKEDYNRFKAALKEVEKIGTLLSDAQKQPMFEARMEVETARIEAEKAKMSAEKAKEEALRKEIEKLGCDSEIWKKMEIGEEKQNLLAQECSEMERERWQQERQERRGR